MSGKKQQYGLFTAISMVVGLAIGAGIFFKTSDVLEKTGGSVPLGVLVFFIGASSIVFGGLSVAEIASISSYSGGIIGYYEEFISRKVANAFGFYQYFIYFPALGSVVAYFTAIYIVSFLGLPDSIALKMILGIILVLIILTLNILSEKFGTIFQNTTTIIKLFPIFALTIAGFFVSAKSGSVSEAPVRDVGFGWLAALVPVAFTYDGWIVTTSIAGDLKNSKKNLPRALTIGPFIVLFSYVLYFIGINKLLGTQYILDKGSTSINKAGKVVFGPFGDKILLVFIIISMLGILNGAILGMLRLANTLKEKKMLKGDIHDKVSIKAAKIPVILIVFWTLVNFCLLNFKLIAPGSDVTSISIVAGYILYTFLYIKVIRMKMQNKIQSKVKGYLFPVLAIIGALIIILGGFASDPLYALIFLTFCAFVCVCGARYSESSK